MLVILTTVAFIQYFLREASNFLLNTLKTLYKLLTWTEKHTMQDWRQGEREREKGGR